MKPFWYHPEHQRGWMAHNILLMIFLQSHVPYKSEKKLSRKQIFHCVPFAFPSDHFSSNRVSFSGESEKRKTRSPKWNEEPDASYNTCVPSWSNTDRLLTSDLIRSNRPLVGKPTYKPRHSCQIFIKLDQNAEWTARSRPISWVSSFWHLILIFPRW